MIKFNYILNDLALSILITKCLHSENANYSDKEELENQIKLIQQENQKYKKVIDKVLEDIKEYKELGYSKYYENEIEIELIDKILKVLGGKEIER